MDDREAVGALFKHTRLNIYTHMEDDDVNDCCDMRSCFLSAI